MLVEPDHGEAAHAISGVGPLIEQLIEGAWNAPALGALAAFLGFFAGYAAGRRRGKSEGRVEGARYAPLELRKETWEKGYCVICGSAAAETPVAPGEHGAHTREAPGDTSDAHWDTTGAPGEGNAAPDTARP